MITTTDARGIQIVQNTYNADGRVTDQTLGDGAQIHIDYPNDTARQVKDGNNHVMEHRYNSQGLFTGYKTPLNQEYTTTYSPAMFDTSGGPRTITNSDPQGRTVVTELNGLNQPVRITDQANRVTEMTYDPNLHLLSTIKDPLGRITRFTYDGQGNVIEAKDPDGNKSTFTYNPQGQVLSTTNPLAQTGTYVYNASHDLTQVTDPLGHKTTFAYDNLSRLTKVTDAKGNSTQYAYDILNRVTDITDALGHTTHFDYDENGNVVAVTDPKGHTTTASYDAMNRLTSTTNAKGETASVQYDAVGNVVSTTDPKGQTTSYTYNALDQVSQVQHHDDTQYTYTYDGVNRLTDLSTGTQQWHFAYDILDRLISENTPQGSLNYSYDTVSRLTGFSSPNTNYAPVQYAYDNLDRLTGITQNGKTYSYSYDALGRRTQLTRPNGVSTTYSYDANSRVTAIAHSKGAQVLEKETLSYDANGNIVKAIKAGGPYGDVNRDYQYDPLNRLTKVDGLGILASSQFKNQGNANAAMQHIANAQKLSNPTARAQQLKNATKLGALLPETASWSFDENGNIASKTVVDRVSGTNQTRSLVYDEADRLIQITKPTGNVMLNYDANGNLIRDSTGRRFSWNAQDQLTQLQTPQLSASFSYDPLGRRARYTQGSTLKTYFYNGLNMLSDGSSKFLHGAGLDEPLQLDSATGSQSYLQDHLGSTSQLMDALNGNSKAKYDYKSYGQLEGDLANPGLSNPFTYTGREEDGMGLMYYRARYYDPELEVFISQDPLGDAQRYVAGNPLGYVDPLGLDAWGDLNNLIAGFGDAGSFGLSRYIRENYGNGQTALGRTVDTSSGVYTAGEVASLAAGGVGVARVGYAGTAKALPYLIKAGGTELEHALAVSAARNNLKVIFRGKLFPDSRIYSPGQILQYYGPFPARIIQKATKTNLILNIEGLIAAPLAVGMPVNRAANPKCGEN